MRKLVKIFFVSLLFFALIALGICFYLWKRQYILDFEYDPLATLTVNGDEVTPKFSKEIKDYHSISLSAITPNLMKFGNTTRKFNVKEIDPQSPVIPFKVDDETYYLHIWADNLFEFETEGAENVEDGKYFLTFQWWDANHTYPSYIVNKHGKILYYRYAIDEKGRLKRTSDFKYTFLSGGRLVYSLNENRTLLVMDKNFQPLYRTKLLSNTKHNELDLDGHHHLILGNNHFLLFATITREYLVDSLDQPILFAVPVIQEVKNGKIIFEWNGLDYPELFLEQYLHVSKWGNGAYDYAHLNTVIIDNNDQNFILSFRGINTLLKIDRKDGHIIWKLSGSMDDFGLDNSQKFYGQHFPYINENNEVIIFDNHNNMMGEKDFIKENSSIKIYKLDEGKKKVLNYKKIALPFNTFSMGNAVPLVKNRYLVSVGSANKLKDVCAIEIESNGHEIWRLKFKNPPKNKISCYYVYKKL